MRIPGQRDRPCHLIANHVPAGKPAVPGRPAKHEPAGKPKVPVRCAKASLYSQKPIPRELPKSLTRAAADSALFVSSMNSPASVVPAIVPIRQRITGAVIIRR